MHLELLGLLLGLAGVALAQLVLQAARVVVLVVQLAGVLRLEVRGAQALHAAGAHQRALLRVARRRVVPPQQRVHRLQLLGAHRPLLNSRHHGSVRFKAHGYCTSR